MTQVSKFLGALIVTLVFTGCAQVSQVASGDVVVRNKMTVTIDQPWNKFERSPAGDNHPTWTVDGVTVDALKFYVALSDGDLIAATPNEPKGQKALAFKSAMNQQEILSKNGFKATWTGVRKTDNVRLSGVIWATVHNGQLYALTYTAPTLAFFAKNQGAVEKIVASARLAN
jgi:hypothetical protein